MKTSKLVTVLFFICTVISTLSTFSQHVIFSVAGDEIPVKRYKLSVSDKSYAIKYKLATDPQGSFKMIPLDDVHYIRRKAGKGVVYAAANRNYEVPNIEKLNFMELHGAVDACKNFKGEGVLWGTFIPSFLVMPVGLLTTMVVSSVPPPQSSKIPQNAFSVNDDYIQSYKKQSHRCKKQLAWQGFALGFSTAVTVGTLIMGMSGN